jgi:hypothetical protein
MTNIKVGTLLKYYGSDTSEETVGLVTLVDFDALDSNPQVTIQWVDDDASHTINIYDFQVALDDGLWDIVAHA